MKKATEPPSTYDILAVCERENTTWCLLSTERSLVSSTLTKEEWLPAETVLSWMSGEERQNALPPSMQEEFVNQTKVLKDKISVLEEEVSGSKQLFDTYRERARVSLQKTANEQQEVEKLLAKAKEECKVQAKRADDAAKKNNHLETEYSLTIENLKSQLEGHQSETITLRASLAECKAQLDIASSASLQGPQIDSFELAKLKDEIVMLKNELTANSRKVLDMEELIEVLKSREQKLIADQKKRSDAARELVEMKDKEISRLEALANEVRTPIVDHDSMIRPALTDSAASSSVVRNLQNRSIYFTGINVLSSYMFLLCLVFKLSKSLLI
jgi:chromosome segregation ATPase